MRTHASASSAGAVAAIATILAQHPHHSGSRAGTLMRWKSLQFENFY
jgi:hypothetical protein